MASVWRSQSPPEASRAQAQARSAATPNWPYARAADGRCRTACCGNALPSMTTSQRPPPGRPRCASRLPRVHYHGCQRCDGQPVYIAPGSSSSTTPCPLWRSAGAQWAWRGPRCGTGSIRSRGRQTRCQRGCRRWRASLCRCAGAILRHRWSPQARGW